MPEAVSSAGLERGERSNSVGSSMRMTTENLAMSIGKWAGYSVLGFIYIPILWLGVTSFSFNPLSGYPFPLSTSNYASLFGDGRWIVPLVRSVLLATAVGLVTSLMAVAVARALLRVRRPIALFVLCVLPLCIPGMTLGAGQFVLFRGVLGLDLGYWSVFVAQLVWAFPFAFLVMIVVVVRFDRTLCEAARDLGASGLRVFWDIELPLLRAGIVGAFLFAFLLSFNELQRTIFVRGLTTTLPIYNWEMASSQQSQVPVIFALSTIIFSVTLPIIGYAFLRLFREG